MKIRLIYSTVMIIGMALVGVGVLTASSDLQIEPFTDQPCLDCHTNQSLLTELAVVEEDVPAAPSEGPG